MDKFTFAERLKEARKNANLTQQGLADIIGRTKSAVSRWESGENTPQLFDLAKIENALGVPGKILMYGTESIESDTLSQITSVSSQLDEQRQKVVLSVANNQLSDQNEQKKKLLTISENNSLHDLKNAIPYKREKKAFAPLIGETAAGAPLLSEEHIEDWLPVDDQFAGRDDIFFLRIKGDSMENLIHEGALALYEMCDDVYDGKIAAIRFIEDGGITTKYVYHEYDDEGLLLRLRFESENDKYEPFYADEDNPAVIVGRALKVEQWL